MLSEFRLTVAASLVAVAIRIKGEQLMSNKLKLVATCAAAVVIAGCGGGGSDGIRSAAYAPVTYSSFDGYKWSSTTEEVVINPSGLFFGLEQTARAYCASETCNIDQYGKSINCRSTNFNGEAGWTLPTIEQLSSLYNANPKPSGWVVGPVWAVSGWYGEGRTSLDFRNGSISNSGSSLTAKAHVTCVKKL